MPRIGLVGPSYQSQAVNADAQLQMNWYCEAIESQSGNAPLVMYPTPGTKLFVNLGRMVSPPVSGLGLFDKSTTNTGSGTAVSTASLTPSSGNECAFFGVRTASGFANTMTPAGGWTAIAQLTHGGIEFSFDQLVSSSIAGVATAGSAQTWSAVLALFQNFGVALPTIIQSTGTGGAFGAGSHPVTFGVNNIAGNTILAVLDCTEPIGTSTISVSDSQGNVYTSLGDVSGTNARQAWFAAQNIKVGANTVSFVNSGLISGASFVILEIPGGSAAVTQSGPIRGLFTINGRTFAVSGTDFDEIFANGTSTNWGTVANDSLPVTMAASPQQLLLASAGTAYVFDLMANTLTPIAGATFSGPVSQAGICDGFFILTIKNTKLFYVSAALNAFDWVTNGSAQVSVFPDNIVSMIVDHRQIWFFSDTKSVVYYDSGNIFPFDVIPGSFMEAGCAAEFSPAQIPNGIAWLGQDERGNGVVWLGPPGGGTPERISNHALEFAIQGYTQISDVVTFTYQDQGHLFYEMYFPTPSVTWCYDFNTQMWHQRGFYVTAIGDFRAAHRWVATFNFGKHLVGDWQSANVYQLHIPVYTSGVWTFADDVGNPVVRVRRAPHISNEQHRQYHSTLQVYMETGLGPEPPLTNPDGTFRGPTLDLRWSDDGGHTWSQYFTRECGQMGKYGTRVRWQKLGRSRDRVYEIRGADPVGYRIVDAYLHFTPGEALESR